MKILARLANRIHGERLPVVGESAQAAQEVERPSVRLKLFVERPLSGMG